MTNTTFETFQEIGPYEQRGLTSNEPSCHNGNLRIRKYRVTVELIDEPLEIIQARIQVLWKVKNHHHVTLLREAAKQYGIELKSESRVK